MCSSDLKGVILAASNSTRMELAINKFLFPVKNKTLIEHIVDKFVDGGIKDICIVIGQKNGLETMQTCLRCNANIIYTYQDQLKYPGTAGALFSAINWIGDSNIIVAMADNYFSNRFDKYIQEYNCLNVDTCLYTYKRNVGKIAKKLAIVVGDSKLKEKPHYNIIETMKYDCYCGLMFFKFGDKKLSYYKNKIKKSKRGEYEITHLCNMQKNRISIELNDNMFADISNVNEYYELIKNV